MPMLLSMLCLCCLLEIKDSWFLITGYELPWVRIVVFGTSCLWYELSWVQVLKGTSWLGYELSRSRQESDLYKSVPSLWQTISLNQWVNCRVFTLLQEPRPLYALRYQPFTKREIRRDLWAILQCRRLISNRGHFFEYLQIITVFEHAVMYNIKASWWCHQMETFTALLALCAGNSSVTGEFPLQRPVTQSCDIFLICAWINAWVNSSEAGDLRRNRAHFYVIVLIYVCVWVDGWIDG